MLYQSIVSWEVNWKTELYWGGVQTNFYLVAMYFAHGSLNGDEKRVLPFCTMQGFLRMPDLAEAEEGKYIDLPVTIRQWVYLFLFIEFLIIFDNRNFEEKFLIEEKYLVIMLKLYFW